MLIIAAGVSLMLVSCAFAWSKGGDAERFGSLAVAAVWLTSFITWRVLSHIHLSDLRVGRSIVSLVTDGALAVSFLVLAIRFSSWWLGIAMLAQSLSFGLTAHYLSNIDEYVTHAALVRYAMRENVLSYLVLVLPIAGTLGNWRGDVLRRRRASEKAGRLARPTFTASLPA